MFSLVFQKADKQRTFLIDILKKSSNLFIDMFQFLELKNTTKGFVFVLFSINLGLTFAFKKIRPRSGFISITQIIFIRTSLDFWPKIKTI